MKTIPLTQGKVALVDDADHGWLTRCKWQAVLLDGIWYAKRSVAREGKKRTILMHRLILLAERWERIDHKDGDGLNNQRSNLRRATLHQNNRNRRLNRNSRTGYKGVYESPTGQIRAQIQIGKKFIHLGGKFLSLEEAARAYDVAALKHFGEFARLNFPDGA